MDVRCGVRVNGESGHDREIPVAECLINFFLPKSIKCFNGYYTSFYTFTYFTCLISM